MKMNHFARYILVSSSLSLAVTAAALSSDGANSSGGGELARPEDGSAWFLGQREVQYCVEIAPGFGMDRAQALATVEESFSIWRKYLAERKVDPVYLSLNSKLLPVCTGSEDLKFYLGTSDAKVDELKSHLSQPVGFAHRLSYDMAEGWGKGLIWVTPPVKFEGGFSFSWTDARRLRALLLHELGHVLGCEHFQDTVMDSDIAWLISDSVWNSVLQEKAYPELLALREGRIDGAKFLYIPEQKNYLTLGWNGLISPDAADAQKTFKLFMGRVPVGSSYARMEMTVGGFLIILGDSIGEKIFEFAPNELNGSGKYDGSSVFFTGRLFKVAKTGGMPPHSSSGSAHTFYGKLTTALGPPLMASFEIGVSRAHQIEVRYFTEAGRRSLFLSTGDVVLTAKP